MKMEKKQSARELFLDTLKNMGIKMDLYNYEDYIWFDYQDRTFDGIEDKNDRYITLEYMTLRDLGDAKNAERIYRIINKVGKACDVVISSNVHYTHYRRKILFVEEIPNIEDYLRTEIQELIRATEMVDEELQKELEHDKAGKSEQKDGESDPTRDLFIQTITELDCDYEMWHDEYAEYDSIVFGYHTEKWHATFLEYSKKVLIENLHNMCGVELSDRDKVKRLREVINKANQEHNATAFYEIDYSKNKMFAEVRCTIPFMAEIPQLITYLDSVMSDLYWTCVDISCEMEDPEDIEDNWDLHQEPS